ncbi:MAG TPA: peptidoglycan-associated lipoprotein Pal [Gemmatimonadales bacterium]|nr:peptidoglycan-associated lipoprotein Pal [Gemmatimonadales bacterium]
MRVSSLLSVLVAAGVLAACGKKPAPEQPAPEPAPAPAPAPTPPPPPPPGPNADSARMANEAMERMRALRADVTSTINFDFDKADIRPADQSNLDRKAAILAANPGLTLRIAGNADERGSDEYNLALGNRRAAAAKRYLTSKGVDGARLDVVSYGEERPLDPGHTEDAWAKNRRDDFEVTAGGDQLVAPQ